MSCHCHDHEKERGYACKNEEHKSCGHNHEGERGCHHDHDGAHNCCHNHENERCRHDHGNERGCHDREGACGCHHHESRGGKKVLIARMVAGAALFAAGLISDINAFFFVSYAVLGYDVLYEAVKDIKDIFNENFLMSVASIGAFVIGEYPEAAAVMLFYQVGELLSDYAVGKSRKSISALMDLRADTARVLRGGEFLQIPCEDAEVGDIILVSAGERVPLDGVIVEGSAYFDTSAITGEALPVGKKENEEVMSGIINTNSAVKIKVTKSFENSTVSKILELVNDENKANSEKFITKFARVYTPCVVAAAVLIAVLPTIFVGDFRRWIYTALLFLVISCPCALVVSVPLTFFAGIGGASKNGVLIKGGYVLECLAKVKNIAFDKTGTLTEGRFSVREIRTEGAEGELSEYAAYAEFYSSHPIARAICGAYGKKIDEARISEYNERAGYGVTAVVDGKKVVCGKRALLAENGIDCGDGGENRIFVAADGNLLGALEVSDRLKSNAKDVISDLVKMGISAEILTGDSEENAKPFADELGAKLHAGLLPQDKVCELSKIQKTGATAFVGDGINDAPVLSRADAGISMGGLGADAAIEASDAVIMTDDLAKIPIAVKTARKTVKIARENIVISLAVKLAIMLFGIFGSATMWLAVFADVGVCLLAVLNALRAFWVKK